MFRTLFLCALLAAVVAGASGQNVAAAADGLQRDREACLAMQGRRFGEARIAAATFVPEPMRVLWMGSTRTGFVRAPFCRLEGVIAPNRRSHSAFEVWLPTRGAWNERFLGVGAGGSLGAMNLHGLADGVNRGFATVATDNGHRSIDHRDGLHWALGEPERIVDFGHRAQHLATLAGRAAARAYYGRTPRHSYYIACSQGGQKAMLTAQRFPADYDGIIAIAPVYSWADEMSFQAWGVRAVTETGQSSLDVSHLQALQDAAMHRCAGPNGLINDPRSCTFDPSELECATGGPDCLTPAQVRAVRQIYRGVETSRGQRLSPGLAVGSERAWDAFFSRSSVENTGGGGSWLGVFRNMVHDDPDWTLSRMDFDTDPLRARERLGAAMEASDPDLDAFAARGGRLLVIHGWADQQVPPQTSIDYYDAVTARRSNANVGAYYRLFMAPGMAHCEPETVAPASPAPVGPNVVQRLSYEASTPFSAENDALTAMQAWVETGAAPERFTMRVRNDIAGIATTTVRLCPHPQRASYAGVGDPRDAASWRCVPG
jgi:feruloyl esterase